MKPWASATALLLVALTSSAFADSIGPGSTAPPLDVKSWYKGTPVTSFENDKLYVVEFWATWCGPCKQSIPHLTELAQKNKDVTFVGVSIWEDDKDDNIKNFVQQMGDKMNYNVAYSGNKSGMAETWMAASGQNGIPAAFVIKEGKIAWIGHPMELEQPLNDIKAGKFDEAAFKVKYAKQAKEMADRQAAYKELSADDKLYKSGKKAEAKAALDKLTKSYPELIGNARIISLSWLAQDDVKAWRKTINEYATSKDESKVQLLGQFALAQTRPGGNPELGKEAVQVALKSSTPGFFTLYYSTMFYRETKDANAALTCCNRLIDLLPSSQFKDNKEVVDDMKKMQADLTKEVATAAKSKSK